MNEKLKPCPFCGKKVYVTETNRFATNQNSCFYTIRCCWFQFGSFSLKADVVIAWNTRKWNTRKEPHETLYCEHGKLKNDYCLPCGRINGGG